MPDLPQNERTAFIVSHGWHTGLVIAANNLGTELAFLQNYFSDSLYYEIGWGDQDFYQANKVTSGMALRAALWPTKSVLHVVSLPIEPDKYFSNSLVIPIKLSELAHQQLNLAIAKSFTKNSNGTIVPIKIGIYGTSKFFSSNERFYLTNNCNNWTATKLSSAGVPISSRFSFTATNVINQVKEANKHYQCCRQSL
ncbi:DUF2459 domain-containing protein [Spartinivicinus ruber]|uniref:DUF2459 domain-containing protein n=1 Tax=Spartinivicinus ruber TaxID=2683272 RepID=UPI0013D6803F|nr:DUF2459 domain-containing protein [Spartinivicinus ruber]